MRPAVPRPQRYLVPRPHSYMFVRTSNINSYVILLLRPRHVLTRPSYKYGVASTLPVLTFIHFLIYSFSFAFLFFSLSCCALSF